MTPAPGQPFPELELPDHYGNVRRLSELAGGDPVFLQFYRGFWCPKEQAFFRRLVQLQDEAEVAYTRFISIVWIRRRWTPRFGPGSEPAGPSCLTWNAATSRHSTCWRQPI